MTSVALSTPFMCGKTHGQCWSWHSNAKSNCYTSARTARSRQPPANSPVWWLAFPSGETSSNATGPAFLLVSAAVYVFANVIEPSTKVSRMRVDTGKNGEETRGGGGVAITLLNPCRGYSADFILHLYIQTNKIKSKRGAATLTKQANKLLSVWPFWFRFWLSN